MTKQLQRSKVHAVLCAGSLAQRSPGRHEMKSWMDKAVGGHLAFNGTLTKSDTAEFYCKKSVKQLLWSKNSGY